MIVTVITDLHSFRGVVLTLLLSSPPLWCSGVLLSDDGLAFSLLLLESLSLMMSYCRQKRAITAAHTSTHKHTHTHTEEERGKEFSHEAATVTHRHVTTSSSGARWKAMRIMEFCSRGTRRCPRLYLRAWKTVILSRFFLFFSHSAVCQMQFCLQFWMSTAWPQFINLIQ